MDCTCAVDQPKVRKSGLLALTSGGPSTHPHGGSRNNSDHKKVFNSSSSRKSEREKSQRRIRLEENLYK